MFAVLSQHDSDAERRGFAFHVPLQHGTAKKESDPHLARRVQGVEHARPALLIVVPRQRSQSKLPHMLHLLGMRKASIIS